MRLNWDFMHPWKLRPAFDKENSKRVEQGRSMTPGHWFHFTDTGHHMELVTSAAVELGKRYDLNAELPLDSSTLLLSAVCHDWGKVDDDIWNAEGPPWFPRHEGRSADIMVNLGLPEYHPAVVAVKLHGRTQQIDQYGEKATRKLMDELGSPKNQWMFFCLLLCDCCGFSTKGRDAGYEQALLFLENSDVCDQPQFEEPLSAGYLAHQITGYLHGYWNRA